MKQLQKSDLKEGEIYICVIPNINIKFLIKKTENLICNNIEISPLKNELFIDGVFNGLNNQFFEATLEEKHWLETCIKADKFISYEEAMKTFIPEYVECTLQQKFSDYELGKIYKVNKASQNVNKIKSHNNQGMAFYQMNKNRFKPSTKEAYDAQFVDKEPKDKVLGIDIDTDENKIVEVESSEGGVFQIGDKITPFDKDSPNKGKPFTIIGFRWNNAKTEICAGTDHHKPNGIRLSQIELYIEPKQLIITESTSDMLKLISQGIDAIQVNSKLSLLEQAKLRYPIGTKFKNAWSGSININDIYTVKSYDNKPGFRDSIHSGNAWIVYYGQWAEIVEEKPSHDFKVGDVIELTKHYAIKGSFIIENIEGNRLIINNSEGNLYGHYKSVLAKNAKLVDDGVLPEKWCVKTTLENTSILEDYLKTNKDNYINYLPTWSIMQNMYFHSKTIGISGHSSCVISAGFIEITFEQFNKYVLNGK